MDFTKIDVNAIKVHSKEKGVTNYITPEGFIFSVITDLGEYIDSLELEQGD